MIFTLEKLLDSVAGEVRSRYPDIKIYSNPNQQGTALPCFFIFFMPGTMHDMVGARSRREIGMDIVYVTRRNVPDAFDQMTEVAEQLDDALDLIRYTDGVEEGNIRTCDREWKIDDGELHYQFTIKAIVSVSDDTPCIGSVETYKGGLRDARDRQRNR